ncbi:hypothetical protein [Larkinella harenae]
MEVIWLKGQFVGFRYHHQRLFRLVWIENFFIELTYAQDGATIIQANPVSRTADFTPYS